MSRSRRAVIIGGGLGGLGVALRLASSGWGVKVFEQGSSFGGKMNRWQQGGYVFDTGPTLITMPWVFEDLFAAAGERLEDHLQLIPVEPLADYVFADGYCLTVPAELPRWLETLRSIEPAADCRFLEFMHLGARLFELSRHTFFKTAPGDFPGWQGLKALRHMPMRYAWGRYCRTVEAFFKDPHLRQLYNRFPTYVGSSPYHIPATLALIPYMEQAFGGWHVCGGLYRIVEILIELARRRDVELATGKKVSHIRRHNGRVDAVILNNGTVVTCDVVVMNGDVSHTGLLLGTPGAEPLPESERSLSGFVILMGIRGRLPQVGHHTVFFSADYSREFHQLFEERIMPDDPTVYVCMPSHTDRSLAPNDSETLFLMVNAPANDAPSWDRSRVGDIRQRIFNRLHQGGFPDLDGRIEVESVWTPDRIAKAYCMPGGAIYGRHSHGWRRAFLRPTNRDRHCGGLYYVGGSVHPGGGTPTVLMSARITSELIGRYEK